MCLVIAACKKPLPNYLAKQLQIAVSSFPYLADHIALWIVMARSRLSGYALLTWSLRNVADWGIVPLACMLALRVCLPLWKVGIHLRWNRFTTAVVLNFIVFWFVCAVWAPVLIVHWLTADDDLLPVAMFLVWSAVAFVLFSPMCLLTLHGNGSTFFFCTWIFVC